jgi:hypothetical protein
MAATDLRAAHASFLRARNRRKNAERFARAVGLADQEIKAVCQAARDDAVRF